MSAKRECHPSSVVTSEPEYEFPIQTTLSGAVRGSFASIGAWGKKLIPVLREISKL